MCFIRGSLMIARQALFTPMLSRVRWTSSHDTDVIIRELRERIIALEGKSYLFVVVGTRISDLEGRVEELEAAVTAGKLGDSGALSSILPTSSISTVPLGREEGVTVSTLPDVDSKIARIEECFRDCHGPLMTLQSTSMTKLDFAARIAPVKAEWEADKDRIQSLRGLTDHLQTVVRIKNAEIRILDATIADLQKKAK